MRRTYWAALGCLAAVGCANFDTPPRPGSLPVQPGLAGPPPNLTPASAEAAARVNGIGRSILAANPINGLAVVQTQCREEQTVRFTTIGAPHSEVFHRPPGDIFITEGLVRQCATDGQLAAVLCLELGKMVSEREAMTAQSVRQPDRQPPIDTGIGRDSGWGVAPDQTRLRELADYDRERKQRSQPLPPPDPAALARLYLVRAGFKDADLQAAGPLIQQAQGNAGLEKQMLGR
jgi:hypothetical protein